MTLYTISSKRLLKKWILDSLIVWCIWTCGWNWIGISEDDSCYGECHIYPNATWAFRGIFFQGCCLMFYGTHTRICVRAHTHTYTYINTHTHTETWLWPFVWKKVIATLQLFGQLYNFLKFHSPIVILVWKFVIDGGRCVFKKTHGGNEEGKFLVKFWIIQTLIFVNSYEYHVSYLLVIDCFNYLP